MKQTPRKPASVRRREISEAVLRLIGERGATSLTAATIAAEVGLTAGALFRHFASLDEILESAVEVAVESVERTFPPANLPPVERLERLVLARIDLIAQNPGLAWLLLSDQVYLCLPSATVERLQGLVRRSKAFLLEALREGIAEGSLRSDFAPEILLVLFTGTVHAMVGAQGVHGGGGPATPSRPLPAVVVEALFELLAPPREQRETRRQAPAHKK